MGSLRWSFPIPTSSCLEMILPAQALQQITTVHALPHCFFVQGSRLKTMGSLHWSFPIPASSCLKMILLTQALHPITSIHMPCCITSLSKVLVSRDDSFYLSSAADHCCPCSTTLLLHPRFGSLRVFLSRDDSSSAPHCSIVFLWTSCLSQPPMFHHLLMDAWSLAPAFHFRLLVDAWSLTPMFHHRLLDTWSLTPMFRPFKSCISAMQK